LFRFLRRTIERLGPYPSALLIAVPLAIVEPLKLFIVYLAGIGHWIIGIIAMICAYAISLFVTHRLFAIMKPKLRKLPWFEVCWNWFVAARTRLRKWLRARVSFGRRILAEAMAAVDARRAQSLLSKQSRTLGKTDPWA
jgi:hypothetical protein